MKLPDPQTLEKVCDDAGASEWHYDQTTDRYYRFYPNGDFGMISGRYLPDPEALWAERVGRVALQGARIDIDALKPSPATCALWKHRDERQNSNK